MAVIRKAKRKIKKITDKIKKTTTLKKPSTKKTLKAKKPVVRRKAKEVNLEVNNFVFSRMSRPVEKSEVIGAQETFVEKTKYYPLLTPKNSRPMPQELPGGYGKDIITLSGRDPWWIYAYWEVVPSTWDRLKKQLGNDFYSAKKILRVYDVTSINFNGKNAHKSFDIELGVDTVSWYIQALAAGKSWCVDLGLRLTNGEFILIIRSNVVRMPLDGPSSVTDEEWMIPEEMFARLYSMGFGLGQQSSPLGKAWKERIKNALFSGVLSSPGVTSLSSKGGAPAKQRKFWLVVDCELIVYGATEPDAKVSVQGKPIKLRQDGTFTFRFALPDGNQVIPVKAESSDGIEERIITPIVTRETKTSSLMKESI